MALLTPLPRFSVRRACALQSGVGRRAATVLCSRRLQAYWYGWAFQPPFPGSSAIEVASGAALLWRLGYDTDLSRREHVERTTLRTVGACFVVLAAYILYDSGASLIRHEAPERSIPGIAIAALSLIVMPLLARAKRRVAAGIGSGAMHADSRQTDFCTYLSAILLGGLLLNALFGWGWADPVAGLAMVPIIAKEGLNGFRGRACCGGCGCR
jgi:hypothetical protein